MRVNENFESHKSYRNIYGALPHAPVTFYLDTSTSSAQVQKVTQNIKAEYIFESSLRHLSATQPKPCRPHASATRGWLAQANASQTPCLIIKNLLGRIGFAFFISRVCYCIIDSFIKRYRADAVCFRTIRGK
jgi:hypothetical protein